MQDLGVKTLCELLYLDEPREPSEAATLLVDMVDQYDGSASTFEKAVLEVSLSAIDEQSLTQADLQALQGVWAEISL